MSQERGEEEPPSPDVGHAEAMSLFYKEHHSRLQRFVARRVGSQDKEDICQETWVNVFGGFDELALTNGHAAKALFEIASCRCADFWRKRGRVREMPAAGEDLDLLAGSLASEFGGVDCLVDLEWALAGLSPRQRETLHYLCVDDLSVAQTARLMGVGEDAVKKYRKEGRERLRRSPFLRSYRPEEDE